MKLSEPQQRVLRTMYEHDTAIRIAVYNLAGYYMKRVPANSSPKWSTLLYLAKEELIILYSRKNEYCHYVLTAKGREVAKELEDARED